MNKKAKKGLKKKFFEVSVPLTASKAHLYGYDAEEFDGKTIKVDMSKNLRGKGLELKAKIKLNGDKLGAELTALQIFPSHIRRSMRRGTDYVEDSFVIQCKDATVRVKPFMITRKRVSRTVRNAIRETAKKHLEAHARVRTAHELFSEIITNKLQKEVSFKVRKIYPLALCEIRIFEVVERTKPMNGEKESAREEKPARKSKKEEVIEEESAEEIIEEAEEDEASEEASETEDDSEEDKEQ